MESIEFLVKRSQITILSYTLGDDWGRVWKRMTANAPILFLKPSSSDGVSMCIPLEQAKTLEKTPGDAIVHGRYGGHFMKNNSCILDIYLEGEK